MPLVSSKSAKRRSTRMRASAFKVARTRNRLKIAAIARRNIYSQPVTISSSKTYVMGSGAAGQPMNSDDTSWPFTSPAGRDASKPHEIDLYIEPSPRDSPTALPKLFTTLEPDPSDRRPRTRSTSRRI